MTSSAVEKYTVIAMGADGLGQLWHVSAQSKMDAMQQARAMAQYYGYVSGDIAAVLEGHVDGWTVGSEGEELRVHNGHQTYPVFRKIEAPVAPSTDRPDNWPQHGSKETR